MSPLDGIPVYGDELAPMPADLEYLKTPPHSVEAEQAVIGGLLIAADSFDAIGDLVSERDFYRQEHAAAFAVVAKLAEQGRPHDVITVHDALVTAGELDKAGGIGYLFELANKTASAANIRAHARVIRERAILRALIATGQTIADAAYAPSGRTAAELLDEAQAAVIALGDDGGTETDLHVSAALPDYVNELERRLESGGISGLQTGFTGLDHRMCGMQPGNLIIIGGRPKSGKTTFAMNIASNVAVIQNKPVLVFSMEMSRTELLDRMIASVGGIPFNLLRAGTVFATEYNDSINPAARRIKHSQLYIDDRAALSIAQMRSAARRQHRKTPLALIVVDYLQLARAKAESRVMEITLISQGLKALAKELGVPVIALSQLSRKSEDQNRRPKASDLRDSGSIEQDADVILLVYRDDIDNQDSPMRGTAEIIIPAIRNGEAGSEFLDSNLAMCRFQNKEREYMPPTAQQPTHRKNRGYNDD